MTQKHLTAVLTLLCCLAVHTAEYFVAPNGNDQNNGSREAPFATVTHATSKVVPGDTVTLRGGIYREGVTIRNSGKPGKPITFRGMPGETVIFTAGYMSPVPWVRTPGRRFVWEAPCPYAINMCFEKYRGSRYLQMNSLDLLDSQPGAFLQDDKTGKVFVHPLRGRDPNFVGVVGVPFFQSEQRGSSILKRQPCPFTVDKSKCYQWTKGILVYGSHVTVENMTFLFFPGHGIRIDAKCEHCIVRNNKIYCGTCGIIFYGGVNNSLIENNYVKNVAGTGILLIGVGHHCLLKGNTTINNGECPPFQDSETGGSGNSYNIAQYGEGYYNVDFKDNLLIGDDPDRCAMHYLMRCKGGVRKHTTQTGNVFHGHGANLFAASNSTALIANNTCTDGKYNIGKLSSGEPYEPVFTDNLFITSHKTDPGFADPAHYDFRLRSDSPNIGKGAHPQPAPVLYVKPGANGSGANPTSPLPSLAQALDMLRGKDAVIYLLEGEHQAQAQITGRATIRNYGRKPVTLVNTTLAGTGQLELDGILLKQSRIDLQGALAANRCGFLETAIHAPKAKLEYSTFKGGNVRCQDLQLRQSLLAGQTSFNATKCVSEENGFVDADELAQHQKLHPESVPSFHAQVKVDAQLRIPADSPLVCAGWLGDAIGGRPAPAPAEPILVENLKVLPLAADRLKITWNTPQDYCDVHLTLYQRSPRKWLADTVIRQELYMTTSGQYCFNELKPGQQYAVHVEFKASDGRNLARELTADTPAKDTHVPRTITVSQDGKADYRTLAAALAAARSGDTVLVQPGIYTESLSIDVDNMTLKSAVPGKAMIDMADLFYTGLLVSNVKNVTIDGLRFIGMAYSAASKALNISKARNITVRNCFFSNLDSNHCANIALFAYKIDGLLVENCVFNSGFHGIWSYPTKNAVVRNNTFWGIGINAIHLGCNMGDRVEIYNNLMEDVVSNHNSPAISVADHRPHVYCDYNLYWKKKCPVQYYYACGRPSPKYEYSAPWSVVDKDMTKTLQETRQHYGVEAHGIEADPLLVDTEQRNFAVKPGSPALKNGRDGKDIGADFSVFQ